jgi:hypothetical protein
MLNQYGLTYAIVGDSVVVTTEDMAVYRQLKQRVNVDLDRVQAAVALKQLARETATNLLVDARAQKDAQNAVSLQIEDVPLETAVRLISEMAGLKPVRMGNVVLVTTRAHALELRSEPDLAPVPRNPNVDPGIVVPNIVIPPIGLVPNPPPIPPAGVPAPGTDPAVPQPPPPDKPAENPPDKPADPPKP